MDKVMVVGAGKIGSLIALLLQTSSQYDVYLADINFNTVEHAKLKKSLPGLKTVHLDVNDKEAFKKFLTATPIKAIISSLPYFCNGTVAEYAKEFDLHYFDLTEDTSVARIVTELSKDASTAFVPQCGLAPGLVGIVANDLMKRFDTIDTVKLRVGALPVNSSNALHYSLTWSTDGLINEYGNLCNGIENGKYAVLLPLEGLESHQIDGLQYEAFNTSGGLGSLAETYAGKVNNMNYKTLRYPGHCQNIRFLMNDLKLNQDRDTLKRILENAIPKTYQDVVVMFVSVNGKQKSELVEENYIKKFYPRNIAGITWTAIQVTTAASLCAVVDIILKEKGKYRGLVLQEHIPLEKLLSNTFGQYLDNHINETA